MYLVFYQRKHVTHRCTLERAVCVTLLLQCTVRYSVAMSRPKPPYIVRYTVRLNRAQGKRVAALKAQLHARSDNEVFDYLVTAGTSQRDDLEQLVYSLFGNLADSLARRFQSLETVRVHICQLGGSTGRTSSESHPLLFPTSPDRTPGPDADSRQENCGQSAAVLERRDRRRTPPVKQEQAVTPQREIAPKQEQSLDIGLGLKSKGWGLEPLP